MDTLVEHDHEFFSDYLKVSLEEVIIALRDDSQLLFDIGKFIDGQKMQGDPDHTLYSDGFTATNFLNVIEQKEVWQLVKLFNP